MKNIEPFSTALLGSLPRSKELMELRRKFKRKSISEDELEKKVYEETVEAVRLQEKYDIDIITNGELSRDNYVSFISEKLEGVSMMNMSDMLDYIDDKKSFEKILDTLDVPSSSIKNAICTGKVSYDKPLVADEMRELKKITNSKIKATLPGPYLITRSMWLPKLSGKFYSSKEELSKDVLKVLYREIEELKDAGVDVIQFDEPVLTEVVFTKGQTRSFMCAALSEKKDPTEELEFAQSLLTPVVNYVKEKNIISSVHVCRGNWSKNEKILLEGPYTPLIGLFEKVLPDILALEFSTPRAGEIKSLFDSDILREKITLGLGVINPRLDVIETTEDIVKNAEKALEFVDKSRLLLNPDCGFATFANRPVNNFENIEKKLKVLKEARDILRDKYL